MARTYNVKMHLPTGEGQEVTVAATEWAPATGKAIRALRKLFKGRRITVFSLTVTQVHVQPETQAVQDQLVGDPQQQS